MAACRGSGRDPGHGRPRGGPQGAQQQPAGASVNQAQKRANPGAGTRTKPPGSAGKANPVISPAGASVDSAVETKEAIALAGLRTAEIERLDWREINLASKFIEVKTKKAKTRARRLVPIVPALAAWLQSYRADEEADGPPTEGPVWPQSLPYLFELQRDAAKEAGVDWKHNALRHSFISYRVADI